MAKSLRYVGVGAWLGCALGSAACDPGGPPALITTHPIPASTSTTFDPVMGSTSDGKGEWISIANPPASTPSPDLVMMPDGDPAQTDWQVLPGDSLEDTALVQVSGGRVYALSRLSGLTISDASNPPALSRVGGSRSEARPRAMYVKDGIVYALFNGELSSDCDTDGLCTWTSGAHVQALDARDPANVHPIADLRIPGQIDGSKLAGNVLYLVIDQFLDCPGCDTGANTRVTSFDVSDPTQFTQLDELHWATENYGDARQVSVADQRIYITGYDYDDNKRPSPGDVQVVDISDPTGALSLGAHFDVAGPIYDTNQMDERDGVLRVLSQPGGWGSDQSPLLETFRLGSSVDIQPQGSVQVQLPGLLQVVQQVRFDGARAFATTSLPRDPVLTFDLSNPAAPRQAASLPMPGWVYHLEPLDGRLFVVGNDAANPAGSLHASLYDVSNLDQPMLLDRVAFGGDSDRIADGHNSTHTAFSVQPDLGLLAIPFRGERQVGRACASVSGGGVQLVDFTDAALKLRGLVAVQGGAKQAFVQGKDVLALGDSSVQSFDISNRDAPVIAGQLDAARNVRGLRVLGDRILRLGRDRSTNQTVLDLSSATRAGDAGPSASVDLSTFFASDASCDEEGWSWGDRVFQAGNYAYVPRYGYAYGSGGATEREDLMVLVIDISDPDAPKLAGHFAVAPINGNGFFPGIVQTDHALLIGRAEWLYASGGDPTAGAPARVAVYSYDVFDLGDPSAPVLASHLDGSGWVGMQNTTIDMGWGWSQGQESTGLTYHDLFITQHTENTPEPLGAKYYLDRLDLSDPYQPKYLPPISIPGNLIHYDGDANRILTVDSTFQLESPPSPDSGCVGRGSWEEPDQKQGCLVAYRNLNALELQGDSAVLTSQIVIDGDAQTNAIAVSDRRVFYVTTDYPLISRFGASIAPTDASPISPVTLETIAFDGGQLTRLPAQELHRIKNDSPVFYIGELYARGERAFEFFKDTLTVVDTLDPTAPVQLRDGLSDLPCLSLDVAGDTAYCAVGDQGVKVVDLSALRSK